MANMTINAPVINVSIDGTDYVSEAGRPIVILATGQSNIQLHPSLAWSPPSNLKIWNWDGGTDLQALSVGTEFSALDGATMGVSYSYASQVAINNPGRVVYLVNIGITSTAIAKWLPGATAPDLYAACKANIEAALVAAGVTSIDELLWWQGESDAIAGSQTYVQDFETVITRFRGESWFPYNTPITIMGVSVLVSFDPKVKFFNSTLRQIASREPENRVYVNTSSFPVNYWIAPELIHMTGEGYKKAGELAYRVAKQGGGKQPTPWQTVVKKYNEIRPNSPSLTDDSELGFTVFPGKTYRVRGSIVGSTSPTADFKYGFRGPTGTVIQTYHHVMQDGAPNSEYVAMSSSSSLPTGQVIQIVTGGNFRVEVDFLIYNPSASGQVRFQWGQNTSDAANTVVFIGSYLEYMEIL